MSYQMTETTYALRPERHKVTKPWAVAYALLAVVVLSALWYYGAFKATKDDNHAILVDQPVQIKPHRLAFLVAEPQPAPIRVAQTVKLKPVAKKQPVEAAKPAPAVAVTPVAPAALTPPPATPIQAAETEFSREMKAEFAKFEKQMEEFKRNLK